MVPSSEDEHVRLGGAKGLHAGILGSPVILKVDRPRSVDVRWPWSQFDDSTSGDLLDGNLDNRAADSLYDAWVIGAVGAADIRQGLGGRIDLSHVRSIVVSGSPMLPEKLHAAMKHFGSAIHNGYGMSETGLVCLLSAADVLAHPETVHAVARPWTGVEMQVRNDAGVKVPLGKVGHIWARSPGLFSRYTNEDGSVILDAEVIVNANVYYTGAIENALKSHPDVDAPYVISVPDDNTDEAAAAFITTARDSEDLDLQVL
ncbi:hypothetical protein F5Y05DRAFT_422017 [Hypoxylon sp. FL0543]|nr:hypothetical protein F5Y05DRAFT_422017 [Hypoxylon sp. FL0543]